MKTMSILSALAATMVSVAVHAEDGYLESDGTQFINTGYHPNPATRIELDCALTDASTSTYTEGGNIGAAIMSVEHWGSGFSANFLVSGTVGQGLLFSIGDGISWFAAKKLYDTNRRTFIFDMPAKTVSATEGGEVVYSGVCTQSMTRTSSMPLGIFGRTMNTDGSSSDYRAKMRVYGMKIYESDVLIHDFVPAVKAGSAGLYDRKTGDFLKNRYAVNYANSEFASGGDLLALEDDGYIESDGTQFINTDYHTNPKTKVVLDYALTDASSAACGSGGNVGARLMAQEQWTTSGFSTTLYVTGEAKLAYSLGDGTTAYANGAFFDTKRRTFTFNMPTKTMSVTQNGQVVYAQVSTATISRTSDFPLGVFGASGDATGSGSKAMQFSKMRVYSLCIYEDDVLIHDYIPAIKGGSAGLYDRKTGNFLKNRCVVSKAISEFTYGGNIQEVADDAFIESDGRQFINTGYISNPKTKLVLDYALTDVSDKTYSQGGNVEARIMGEEEWSSGLSASLFVHSTLNVRVIVGDGTVWENVDSAFNCQRRTITFDLPNANVSTAQNGQTDGLFNCTYTKSWKSTRTANFMLGLFGRPMDATGTTWGQLAKVRVYSLKIYESGTLVRDFEPYVKDGIAGLRETVNGGFYTSVSPARFKFGGNIASEGDSDAYLSSTQQQFINTGYFANSNSRIEVDFAMNSHTNQQERLFGVTAGNSESYLKYGLYCNGSTDGAGSFSFLVYNGDAFGFYASSTAVDVKRHTAIADLKGGTWSLVTGSTTNTYATKQVTTTSDYPMGVFGTPTSKDGSIGNRLADMRVYAVRIYENDALVHHYLPYKNGSTVGLLDVVTGTVKEDIAASGVPFTVGGCGWGEDHATFYSEPTACTAEYDRPATLKAFAPGATKYQWYCGDTLLEGETDNELSVPYARHTESRTYCVKATFVVNGVEVERTSSAATVTMTKRGLLFIVQ